MLLQRTITLLLVILTTTIGLSNPPRFIDFEDEGINYTTNKITYLFKERLGLRTPEDELREYQSETDDLGYTTKKYQQYYKNIKVEFAII